MFVPLAACSAALSGALVLAMVGWAVGAEEQGRAVSSVRSAQAVLAVPLAVPTTPAAPVAPVDGAAQALTAPTRAAVTAPGSAADVRSAWLADPSPKEARFPA